MFALVEIHGRDISMSGTASLATSLERFPNGKVLHLVDDGPYHSMKEAEGFVAVMMGRNWGEAMCKGLCPFPFAHHEQPKPGPASNVETKRALGYELIYPSYRHGAAKMFAAGEFKGMEIDGK